jgi:hypothetical protein
MICLAYYEHIHSRVLNRRRQVRHLYCRIEGTDTCSPIQGEVAHTGDPETGPNNFEIGEKLKLNKRRQISFQFCTKFAK